MSSKEMKKRLIAKIQSTDDDKILEEVYRILEVSTQEVDMIMLSDDQKAQIDNGLRDIEEGRYLTNDEANRGNRRMAKKIIWSETAQNDRKKILLILEE